MKWRQIIKEMSGAQARRFFAQHGIDVSGLDAAGLKSNYRRLAQQLHPDRGGSTVEMQHLNAAYDALRQPGATGGSARRPRPEADRAPEQDEYPVWAMAGYSGGARSSASIYRHDYRDLNFIKKRIWELSGQSREEWTVWAFDGRFFRGVFTVFGSTGVFPEMARAMLEWETFHRIRAVFVQRRRSRDLMLIWLDGHDIEPPIPMETESFNSNPGNDQSFVNRLPDMLDEIARSRGFG